MALSFSLSLSENSKAFKSHSNIHVRMDYRKSTKLFKQGNNSALNIEFISLKQEERRELESFLGLSPFSYMRSFNPAT